MKTLFLVLTLSLSLPAYATFTKRDLKNQEAQQEDEAEEPGLKLCPDGNYVRGDECVLCPNGRYYAHKCKLGPDGKYR